MEGRLKKLKNMHVSADDKDGEITFLHKVKEGSVDKSYGINVAKLAGLPDEVIKRASDVLSVYEKKEVKRDTKIQTTLPLNFESKENIVEEKLKKINILEITPMEAINLLYDLNNNIK